MANEAMTPRERAHALLRGLLTPEEYREVLTHGYLTLRSPNYPEVTYRIPRGPGFVQLFESGQRLVDLCVQPLALLPDDDIVVMHKLQIEGNEQEYLATANRFAPHIERRNDLPQRPRLRDDYPLTWLR